MGNFCKGKSITSFLLALCLVGLFAARSGYAVDPLPLVGKQGTFNIIWGDSELGESSMEFTLTTDIGELFILQLDPALIKEKGGIHSFNGKLVEIIGIDLPPIILPPVTTPLNKSLSDEPTAEPKVQKLIDVHDIYQLSAPKSLLMINAEPIVMAAVTGSHPWVTIMCKFSDFNNEPNDVTYFQNMYDDPVVGLNVYWQELSYNTADVTGSMVGGTGWYDLPNTEAHYNPTDTEKGTDRSLLADECIAAVDADVDFSLYSGINMMFNTDFDNGWAWGGSRTMTLDGVTKTWSVTWEPPWSYQNISVIAHEMGHGFGLPHSSFDRTAVYDNPWDVMSQDRYNCAAATDPTYGCVAQHTISYHKDMLDWIPTGSMITIGDGSHGTFNLEDLAAPASGTPGNYQMATIPIPGSLTEFYTVEARRFTGFDHKLPEEAVVIHLVDTTDGIPAVLVPDGSVTDGWTVGETYTDMAETITVRVNSDTGTGFNVTIANGNLPPVGDANGPYSDECAGETTSLVLDASGSSDPEGEPLSYLWSTTCDGSFDDATSVTPTLTVNTSAVCNASCSVSVMVTDEFGLTDTSPSSTVTIYDTLPPVINGVPADQTVECDAVPEPAYVTTTDVCDPGASLFYDETRTDGSCEYNYTLTRTWDSVDGCGNSSSQSQVIMVEDTTEPEIYCETGSGVITPPDAPIAFTATATDNCDDNPDVAITGYDCFMYTKKGKRIDKTYSCVVDINGDTITILNSGGVGDNITWTVETTDTCGNVKEETCTILVEKP